MKTSYYNYILEQGRYSYWYNGVTHFFFRLPIELGNKLKGYLADSFSFNAIPATFYQKLLEGGFIISDEADELDLIRKKNRETVNDKNYFLTILPTLNCNFECWYCIQEHIPSRMSATTIEQIKRHIDHMIDQEGITSLTIEWFGGEPFIYFHQVIRPICEYAQSRCAKNNIPYMTSATTNGFFLNPPLLEHLKKLQFKRFHITLDGPKKNHDKVKYQKNCSSAFDRVLQNIDFILKNTEDIFFLLRVNYTEENLDPIIVQDINQIITPENRSRIRITPKKVWQENVQKERSVKIIELMNIFEQAGYQVTYLDIIENFVPCYTNRKYYNTINYNGDVLKCTACNDLYEKKIHGMLNSDGTISWDKDFLKRYEAVSFENNRCLSCKYLPICMGICPRDYDRGGYCKYDGIDTNITEAIIAHIDSSYC